MTHHHHPGHSHPPAAVKLSLLRLSLGVRLVVAAAVVAAIWLPVWWVLR